MNGGFSLKKLFNLSPENAWCLYDWGNSAFVTTIVATVLPVYFAETVCSSANVNWTFLGRSISSNPTSLWGYAMALAAMIVALAAPVFGATADAGGRRKQFLGILTGLGVISTVMLSMTGVGDVWAVLGILVLGQVGFAGANVFYNSLLVSVADPPRRDLVSSKGYALGYMGGGILLALNLLMLQKPTLFGFSDASQSIRYVFISVAVWWSLFSIPLFLKVPEGNSTGAETFFSSLRSGLSTLGSTFRRIRSRSNVFRFLISFLLYNDGIQTVIMMAAIYGKMEMGLKTGDLIGALLLTQAVGVPSSLFFGWLARRFGSKRMLFAGISAFILIILYAYQMSTALDFWILATAVGLVMGGMQAVSRGFYSRLIPQEMNAEFFGFFSVSQRFASIFGPLLFALIIDLTGSSRLSILCLAVLFIAGGLMLTTVKEPEEIQ